MLRNLQLSNAYNVSTSTGQEFKDWSGEEYHGAALSIQSCGVACVIELHDCIFENNTAVRGAAVYLNGWVGNILIVNCTFRGNSALEYGGAVFVNYIYLESTAVSYNNWFISNSAGEGGGAFASTMHLGEYHTFYNSRFEENSASIGGAVYIDEEFEGGIQAEDCVFVGNYATTRGGAVYLLGNADAIARRTLFTSNYAFFGAGALYLRGGGAHKFANSSFIGNLVTCPENEEELDAVPLYIAGAVEAHDTVTVTLTNCVLEANVVSRSTSGYAGALALRDESVAYISATSLQGNKAYAGGAMSLHDHSSAYVWSSLFQDNSATYGGGLYLSFFATAELSETIFEGNFADLDGGAMYHASDTAALRLDRCEASDNMAYGHGGAFSISGTGSLEIANTTFSYNMANNGASGFVDCTVGVVDAPCGVTLQGVHAEHNHGGATSALDLERHGYQSWASFIMWRTGGNSSQLAALCDGCTGQAEWNSGAHYGTEFANLKFLAAVSSADHIVSAWSGFDLEEVSVGLVDQLGNVMVRVGDAEATLELQLEDEDEMLDGVSLVKENSGVLSFTGLSFTGFPGVSYFPLTLSVLVSGADVSEAGFSGDTLAFTYSNDCGRDCMSFEMNVTLELHMCGDGMVLSSTNDGAWDDEHGECKLCVAVDNAFSFAIMVNDEVQVTCLAPPQNAMPLSSECLYGWSYDKIVSSQCNTVQLAKQLDSLATTYYATKLVANQGFWHSSSQSVEFHACIIPEACTGPGVYCDQDNDSCNQTAAATAVFDVDLQCAYGHSGALCAGCIDGWAQTSGGNCKECVHAPFAIAVTISTSLALLLVMIVYTIHSTTATNKKAAASMKDSGTSVVPIHSQIIKVMVTYTQVAGIIIHNIEFGMEEGVIKVFDALTLFRTSDEETPALCTYPELEGSRVYASLIYQLCTVVLVVGLIFAVWSVLYVRAKRASDTPERDRSMVKQFRRNVAGSIIVALFFLWPAVLTVVLQLHGCHRVDTGQVSADFPSSYSDYSEAVGYYLVDDMNVQCFTGTHFLWVWLLGIPMTVMWGCGIPVAFYRVLTYHKDSLHKSHIVEAYGFLYIGYEIEFYYYESVVMARKMGLLVVTIFAQPFGGTVQLLLALMVEGPMLLSHTVQRPYEDEFVDGLQAKALQTVSLSLVLAVLLFESSATVGSLLFILILLLNVLLCCYIVFLIVFAMLYGPVKEMDADGDGHVSRSEFLEFLSAMLPENKMLRSTALALGGALYWALAPKKSADGLLRQGTLHRLAVQMNLTENGNPGMDATSTKDGVSDTDSDEDFASPRLAPFPQACTSLFAMSISENVETKALCMS
ncbi:hypothetical protein CYMTET_41822 [Cymbomonas tetramitiformis]|uniref:EF-hand domain-containing protein n=1 Tax=Cymbomonas tetramitiformis TaxID=36881 RepID=A0AAE0F246_9CHLO|nr:hypothetical protein CYMTET_41822 [Cymbomonas tetramitiformis]